MAAGYQAVTKERRAAPLPPKLEAAAGTAVSRGAPGRAVPRVRTLHRAHGRGETESWTTARDAPHRTRAARACVCARRTCRARASES